MDAIRPCKEGKLFGYGSQVTCVSPEMPKGVDRLTVVLRHPEKRPGLTRRGTGPDEEVRSGVIPQTGVMLHKSRHGSDGNLVQTTLNRALR